MGLLDMLGGLDSADGRFALGLLAAARPQPVRTGTGEGLLSAINSVDAWKRQNEDRDQKKALQEQQMALIRAQIADMAAQQKLREVQAAKPDQIMSLFQSIVGQGAAPSQYGVGGGGVNLGGVSEPMTPRPAGIAGASADQIALLKLLSGQDLSAIAQQARVGDEVKPGTYYQRGNQREYVVDPAKGFQLVDGKASLVPGFAAAQGELAGATKGAEAAATAPYTLVDVFQNGVPGKVPLSSIIGQQPRYAPAPTTPEGQAVRLGEVAAAEGDLRRWAEGLRDKKAGGGLPMVQTGPSQQQTLSAESIKSANQSFLKTGYEPAIEAGNAADRTVAAVDMARRALAQLGTTGWGTPMIASGAAVLGALGVPQAEKFATNAQIFQSSAMERLWTTLNVAKGPQTEGDADRASKTFASLKNTPQANQFILDSTQALAQRDKMKAQFFANALPIAQRNGDLQELEREWQKRMPSIFNMPSMQKWQ